jgi:adenosine kinase
MEGILFALGNPLLDIQAHVEKAFLDKWELKENDAILCGDKHVPMFTEMTEKYDVEYLAGGATQNSCRVAQWIIGKPNTITFTGCIGNDHFGKVLEEKAKSVGLNTIYQRHPSERTGTCACCIYQEHRSLCAHLAAANCFSKDHLEVASNKALMEQAKYYYIAGFPLTVSPESMLLVAEHACANNKLFCMNLSAPFLVSVFKEPMMKVLPYVDILFGNESEAAEFSKVHEFGTESIPEIAVRLSALEKANKARSRMVVITQGHDHIVVAQDGKTKTYPVPTLNKEQLVDTNGAGDAFVGGFLAQLISGKSTDECVRCGIWAAQVIIGQSGCSYPDKCEYA